MPLSLAVLAIQWQLFVQTHASTVWMQVGDAVLDPLIIVYANILTAADMRGETQAPGTIVGRGLERLWAVILIDFALGYLYAGAFFAQGQDLAGRFLGFLALLLLTTLLMADVFASTEHEVSTLALIPLSFFRSITLSWQNGNMRRLVWIMAAQIALIALVEYLTLLLLHRHYSAAQANFYAVTPLATLLTAPFAVLTTVIYLDCLARERERLKQAL